MYLMQTVSAVPRSRTVSHMDTRSCANPNHGGYQKLRNNLSENGTHNLEQNVCLSEVNNGNRILANKKVERSEIISLKNANNHDALEGSNQVENDDEKEKKKEKKWTIGGLFRRKSKKDADDSSDQSDGENNKGFLSKRKSKREKRKLKARSTANGFDVIIPQRKDNSLTNGIGLTAEQQLWNGETKSLSPGIPENSGTGNGSIRYIHRHQNAVSNTETSKAKKNHLQVPKSSRRDSNLSRSSGGSENLEGRKGRKEVRARVEAKRDLLHDESSSDENESFHSNSSLNRLSEQGHRRPRRSDKHKRYSREEDFPTTLREGEIRMIKSDFEGNRRLPAGARWISRTYPDSSDLEAAKFNLINHSETPSPARSPRIRPKQMFHSKQLVPNSYPTSTFPPGIHHQQFRITPNHFASTQPNNHIFTKEIPFYGSHSFVSESLRGRPQKTNHGRDYTQNLPRSFSSMDSSVNRRSDLEQFSPPVARPKEKSQSYDHIHKTPYFENDLLESSELPKKYFSSRECHDFQNSTRQKEMFLNEEKINVDIPLRPLKTYGNGVVENRTDSTTSLSIQPGMFPRLPTQVIQRSASGHLFSNSPESSFNSNKSNCVNGKPNGVFYWSQEEDSLLKSTRERLNHSKKDKPQERRKVESSGFKPNLNSGPSILRYYADQNPRSRNPIHITCNPMPDSKILDVMEQPCLSDSQAVTNSPQNRLSASEFWRLKDRNMRNYQDKKLENLSLKPPLTQTNSKSDTVKPNSPKEVTKANSLEKYSNNFEKVISEQLNHSICTENKLVDNNRKILKEEYNAAKANRIAPEPPIRRLSKQEVLARLQKCEQLKAKETDLNQNLKNDNKFHNSNLDEALNELEVIYNSLKLKDEDLVDRAERRDLPALRLEKQLKEYNPTSVCDKIQNFYAETDFSHNLLPRTTDPNVGRQKALPLRKSAVPDKTTDDMAFRRMNCRDRSDAKKFPSQSYLRSSPALSPVLGGSSIPKELPAAEPDITFDDVVFRNIRHANSTLKIQDPQPPFGIPIGVITPAPNSDYLHARPTERFRPTFMSTKTPDVVKDDLAFRNLRKDQKTGLVIDVVKNDSNNLLKKRAVRSLSANLFNIMQKNNSGAGSLEPNNNTSLNNNNSEKTQSLTDLSNDWAEKQALEKRLKELKEEKNSKRAEFFELSQKIRKRKILNDEGNLSWTDLANLNDNFGNTLENSSEALRNSVKRSPGAEKKNFRSPVVQLSKYPAAAPSSSLQGNPFKETSVVDEDQLEDLLSALAIEAKNTSLDLERQLDQLESAKEKEKCKNAKEKDRCETTAKEKFETSLTQGLDVSIKPNSIDRSKRRRNLSLSSMNEWTEETPRTGSLERRKYKNQSSRPIQFNEFLRKNKKANDKDERTAMDNFDFRESANRLSGTVSTEPQRSFKSSKPSKPSSPLSFDSNAPKKEQSQSVQLVTDLSQILRDVEVEQHKNEEISQRPVREIPNNNNKDVFQEVYEYNCRLSDFADEEKHEGDVKLWRNSIGQAKQDSKNCCQEINNLRTGEESVCDVEKEFEKLHQEANSSAENTKNTQNIHTPNSRNGVLLMDDLMADIVNVEVSPGDAHSSFPFPREGSSADAKGDLFKSRDGAFPCSSKGEGEIKKASLDNTFWLACSYALAFAFHLQQIDFLTALGIVLAVVSIVAILIL